VRLYILASGSGGNAVIVESGANRIALDCGLSLRQLERRMKAVGLASHGLDALFASHEHIDHVRGVPSLARRRQTPLFATRGTVQGLVEPVAVAGALVPDRELKVGTLAVTAVSTSHDAAEPVAFVVGDGACRVAVVTDTGMVGDALLERLAGCHGLLLECNHDPDLLRVGPYPWPLKRRIASAIGHLSNVQARMAIEQLAHGRLEVVIGMHLSRENNAPELALRELALCLAGSPVHVATADQDRPLVVEVCGPQPRRGQLGLFE
jgi:phosphoribosyl 1,2-cyclic phosphodiesterase